MPIEFSRGRSLALVTGLLLCGDGGAAGQECVETRPASVPTAAFELHPDGTATHRATGLMWMRCSHGERWDGRSCSGVAKRLTWVQARSAAGAARDGGHQDWRLPTMNELQTVIESRCLYPALNQEVFPITPDWSFYWSETVDFARPAKAWTMILAKGTPATVDKGAGSYVRFVRGTLPAPPREPSDEVAAFLQEWRELIRSRDPKAMDAAATERFFATGFLRDGLTREQRMAKNRIRVSFDLSDYELMIERYRADPRNPDLIRIDGQVSYGHYTGRLHGEMLIREDGRWKWFGNQSKEEKPEY